MSYFEHSPTFTSDKPKIAFNNKYLKIRTGDTAYYGHHQENIYLLMLQKQKKNHPFH